MCKSAFLFKIENLCRERPCAFQLTALDWYIFLFACVFLSLNFLIQLSTQAPTNYIFHSQCILPSWSVLCSPCVCVLPPPATLQTVDRRSRAVLHFAFFKLAFFSGTVNKHSAQAASFILMTHRQGDVFPPEHWLRGKQSIAVHLCGKSYVA